MALRKDDPVYYKDKIKKLVQQARDNGLEVFMSKNNDICFKSIQTGEIASTFRIVMEG